MKNAEPIEGHIEEREETALQVRGPVAVAPPSELTVEQLVEQVAKVQEITEPSVPT